MDVLHVDDDCDIREITRLSLEMDSGFGIRSAPSAEAALAMIADARPEVILLDVMMPDVDGPAMFRSLQARPKWADIPVIFMTAAAQKHMTEDLMEMGAIGVIGKPFDPMALADELRSLIARHSERAA